jgi:hypothetical protein
MSADLVKSATGGATLQAPPNGFSDRDLVNYFQRIYKPATRTPTRSIPTPTSKPTSTSTPTSSPSKTNIGAIAGGAAGGFVFLLLVVALFVYLSIKRKRRARAAAAGNQQGQQPIPNMQQRPYVPAVEVGGGARRNDLAELPTNQFGVHSPTAPKSGLQYSVASLSSAPSSTTYSPPHSPPHSPPPVTRPLNYDYEGPNPGSAVPPYGVPAYHNPNPPGHAYPVQQPYPGIQSVYVPQQHQQPHYPPPQQFPTQYPPPQFYAPSHLVHGPDIPRSSNPNLGQSSNLVPRREVGSISSTGSQPGLGGEADREKQE